MTECIAARAANGDTGDVDEALLERLARMRASDFRPDRPIRQVAAYEFEDESSAKSIHRSLDWGADPGPDVADDGRGPTLVPYLKTCNTWLIEEDEICCCDGYTCRCGCDGVCAGGSGGTSSYYCSASRANTVLAQIPNYDGQENDVYHIRDKMTAMETELGRPNLFRDALQKFTRWECDAIRDALADVGDSQWQNQFAVILDAWLVDDGNPETQLPIDKAVQTLCRRRCQSMVDDPQDDNPYLESYTACFSELLMSLWIYHLIDNGLLGDYLNSYGPGNLWPDGQNWPWGETYESPCDGVIQ